MKNIISALLVLTAIITIDAYIPLAVLCVAGAVIANVKASPT